VIGPDGIPKITDRDQARREPQLTVLSVLAHGQADVETATAIGGAAAWAILPFPEEQRLLCSLLIESNLSDAARKAIEMQPGLEKFFTETQRRNYERGKAEGKAEGEAAALLKILTRRGLTLTADHRRRIVECTDLAMLEHWLDRALMVSSAEELFR
jgi:flagellar biosynthesis/type III secretory pathway protein FliH